MILTEFPNLSWLKKQAEASFSNQKAWGGKALPSKGWPTVILNVETTHTYRDNIRGPLSIFTNLQGESAVETGNRKVLIKEGYFFVTNHDQYYTLAVDNVKTKTFNIHFGEYFADEVLSSLSRHPEKMLGDSGFIAPFERIEFHNKLFVRKANINRAIIEISTIQQSILLLEEKLYQLVSFLFDEHKEVEKMKDKLPVLKNSTREEITKRLLYSIDYIHSFYDQNPSLEDLASVSCLSKFHFLRLFKIAFGKTPYQYLSEIKIQKGKELLKGTHLDVNAIANVIGFHDASSFSRMFYNVVGVYPSQYRFMKHA